MSGAMRCIFPRWNGLSWWRKSRRCPRRRKLFSGVINIRGRIIPVVDVRKRFNLPEREISLSDHLIIARTARRSVVLLADAVSGVVERPEEEITASRQNPARPLNMWRVGVVKLEGFLG